VSAGADGERYRLTAERILASLASPAYLARGTGTPSVLLHSVGHRPRDSEVDVALNYADYYFVEALLRYLELRDLRERAVLPRGPR
jgi:unsaturated chondroitin disaccharide hydrolase